MKRYFGLGIPYRLSRLVQCLKLSNICLYQPAHVTWKQASLILSEFMVSGLNHSPQLNSYSFLFHPQSVLISDFKTLTFFLPSLPYPRTCHFSNSNLLQSSLPSNLILYLARQLLSAPLEPIHSLGLLHMPSWKVPLPHTPSPWSRTQTWHLWFLDTALRRSRKQMERKQFDCLITIYRRTNCIFIFSKVHEEEKWWFMVYTI